MPETYLTLLQQAAMAADRSEAALRREFTERIAGLERERSFANRRLHLMRALSAAIGEAQDEAAAFAAGERVLGEEFGLTRASEAHAVVVERFGEVTDIVDTALNCEGEPDHEAVLAALERFERWYEERVGKPFMALYDVYRPMTPTVDF